MKEFTMIVDRQRQNARGAAIVDFKAYFDAVMLRLGKGVQYNYFAAQRELRTECHIFVCIK